MCKHWKNGKYTILFSFIVFFTKINSNVETNTNHLLYLYVSWTWKDTTTIKKYPHPYGMSCKENMVTTSERI